MQILPLIVGNLAEIAKMLRSPRTIEREKQIATIALSSIVYRFFKYFQSFPIDKAIEGSDFLFLMLKWTFGDFRAPRPDDRFYFAGQDGLFLF